MSVFTDRAAHALVTNMTTNMVVKAQVRASAGLRAGVAQSAESIPPILRALGEGLDARKINRNRLLEANLEIANQARSAVAAGWRSRLPRNSGSYRPEDRLTGRLGPALDSEAMTAGTTESTISFINTQVLQNEAKHWYRVNYGAVGQNLALGHEPGEYPVPVAGHPIFTLRDESAPAKHTWLPKFFGWEGNELINPKGKAEPRGKGIAAARFTDLGLESVAHTFGPVYMSMFETFIQEEANRLHLATGGVTIPWPMEG